MASLTPWIWTWAREMMRDRETWHAAVLSVAESRTWLGDWTTTSGVYAYNTLPLIVAYQKEACRATQLPESTAGLVTPAWNNARRRNLDSNTISFRMDWLDILAVQGTLKSLLQYHSSKASVLQSSAFFIVQCSHPHMTSGKNINMLPHGPKWMLQFQPVCSHMNILSRKKGNIFFFFSSIRTGSHGPFN